MAKRFRDDKKSNHTDYKSITAKQSFKVFSGSIFLDQRWRDRPIPIMRGLSIGTAVLARAYPARYFWGSLIDLELRPEVEENLARSTSRLAV